MALLKSLIQRLLDSRTTPEQAGHSAMPNTGIRMTVADGASTIFTAPSDGYVYQFVNGSSNSSTYSICNNSTLGLQGQCNAGNGGQNRTFVPCRKGDEITCTRQGSPKTDVTIIFFATIGGGYLRHFVLDVCKRGELCRLKALSLCLPRSFCKASILTLLINVGRVQQYRTKTFREEVNKISLPHLVVGPCFRLEGLMTSPISGSDLKTPQERLAISLTPLVGGNGPRSRYRRAMQSLWILASTRVRGILLLFATNRLNNLQTGGALC